MNNMYTNAPYSLLTDAEHRDRLLRVMAMFLSYIEGDTFKTILMAQDDDYLLQTINYLKLTGAL